MPSTNPSDAADFALVTRAIHVAHRSHARRRDARPRGIRSVHARRLHAHRRTPARMRRAHPVRFWNYIPDIHRPCGEAARPLHVLQRRAIRRVQRLVRRAGRVRPVARDRLGRRARRARTSSSTRSRPSMPGHRGRKSAADSRVPIFAPIRPRAALLRPRDGPPRDRPARCVLVGGTASIRGEESVHVDDLPRQTRETFENLAAWSALPSATMRAAGLERVSRIARLPLPRVRPRRDRELVEPAFPALRSRRIPPRRPVPPRARGRDRRHRGTETLNLKI